MTLGATLQVTKTAHAILNRIFSIVLVKMFQQGSDRMIDCSKGCIDMGKG
jgi:hypothetical protein